LLIRFSLVRENDFEIRENVCDKGEFFLLRENCYSPENSRRIIKGEFVTRENAI